ncbi:MAG: phage virion morphogenesis protein [Rhodocyclaceae bacterium]|nr:phage virion morphogenesis protein [Rhodocyclaceae bacterium]
MAIFSIEIKDGDVQAEFNRLQRAATDMSPAMQAVSQLLLSRTEANFAAQSGPGGGWPALAPSTLKRRGADARMLQDTGHLASSITPTSGPDFAAIGTNVVYAAIHQLGGDISRAPFSSWVRLRQERNGSLMRQPGYQKLAVFAKDSHKRAKTVKYTSDGFSIHIPARPYFPVTPEGSLQDGLSEAITAELARFLQQGTAP